MATKTFKDRDAFTFYRSYYELAKEIPQNLRGQFYEALVEYQFTGKEPKLKGVLKLAWAGAKYAADKQVKGFVSYLEKGNQYNPDDQPNDDPKGDPSGVPNGDPSGKYKSKGKDKDNKKNNIDERKLKFAETLKPFIETYGKEMIKDFYLYWTEPNKSNTMFRQELQRTWSAERRLFMWNKNNFGNKNKGGDDHQQTWSTVPIG